MAPIHVILHPLPAAGHVIASAALALSLASSDFFFVSFACAHHRLSDPRAGNKLVAPLLLPLHSNIRVIDLEDNLPPSRYSQIDNGVHSLADLTDMVQRTRDPFERMMADLMARPNPPVCLITDFLTYTTEFAEKFGIPLYLFFSMAARELAFQFYVPVLQTQGLLPLRIGKPDRAGDSSLADSLYITVPGLPPWRFDECNSFILETASPEFRQGLLHFCSYVQTGRGILINTFDELEADAMDVLRNPSLNPNKVPIYSVGPLLSSTVLPTDVAVHSEVSESPSEDDDDDDDPEGCLRWLSTRPPSSVIYISFGSIFIPSLEQISELAHGLEATNASFIWVVRPPLSTTGDVDDDESSGTSEVLPEGFRARTADTGLVLFSWAPQQRILAHPSTAAFFTHCGWNSVMESIYFGVPTIGFPQFYDQMTNCKILVEQLGMGVEARRGGKGMVCREEVERVVGTLLRDEEEGSRARENARQWSNAAKRSLSSGQGSSSSSINLRAFLSDLSTPPQLKV